MADDQETSNEIGDGGDAPEISDYEDTTAKAAAAVEQTTSSLLDDYDDEPIEDYVVKLVVNEQPDGIAQGIADAAVTDIYGNVVTRNPLHDYTTAIYDELNGNGTSIADGKRWWGWSTTKLIIVGLIALTILAIIIAIVALVIVPKFKKNKRSPPAASTTTTTKAVVTKSGTAPKYEQVPNV